VSEKKPRGRPKKAELTTEEHLEVTEEAIDAASPFLVSGQEIPVEAEQMMEDAAALQSAPVFLLPVDGPDYRITQTGEIVLFDGSPIPEDHHVHPSHRRIAAERKEASRV
jgi:hypothetical protein